MSKIQELIRAVQSGNLEGVRNLIEFELVNINASTTVEIKSNTYNGSLYNTTALHEACRQQNHEIVAYLLEKGADVNKLAAVSPTERQDNLIGWTVLHSLAVGCCFQEKLKPAQLSSILETCNLLTKKVQDKKLFDYKIAITSRYDSGDDDQITIEHTAESLAFEYEHFEFISISELIKTMNSSDHFTLEKKAEAPEEEVQFTNLIFSKESLGSVSREFKTRTALPYSKKMIEDMIDYINDTDADVLLTQEEKTEQLKKLLSNFIIKLGVYSLSGETYPEPLGEYYYCLELLRNDPNEQHYYIEKTYWFFAGLLNALWEHQKPMNKETCFIEITDQEWFINTNEILKKAIEETSTFEAVKIEKPKISINIPPNLK